MKKCKLKIYEKVEDNVNLMIISKIMNS